MIRALNLLPILFLVLNCNPESLYLNFIGLLFAWIFYYWTKNFRSGRVYLLKMWKGVEKFNSFIDGKH